MGAGEEESAPPKHSKPNHSVQEAPIAPSYADWSSSMQAYYGAGAAPAFYASTVTSPTPHPYMWTGQHPIMPPYGTPIPYPALYPPGGVYAHPSITTNPNIAPINGEPEGKTTNGKDRTPTKKSKGTSGNSSFIGGKVRENKAGSSSGNDGATQSAETGSDGSSDATEENNTNQESAVSKKGSFHKMLVDGASAQNNSAGANIQISVIGNPGVSVPVTNLSIGMDLWNASPAGNGSLKVRHNSPGAVVARDGMIPDQWGHDERELKRQKRKQSNRESARRSRLRKQAECDELQGRVEALTDENRMLRDEMRRLSEECEKITFENKAIKEELISLCGPDDVSKLENEILGNTGDT